MITPTIPIWAIFFFKRMKNIKDKWSVLANNDGYKFLTFPKSSFKSILRECTEKQIDALSGALVRYLLLDETPTFKKSEETLESKWDSLVEEVDKIVKKYQKNNTVSKPFFSKKQQKNDEIVIEDYLDDDSKLPF